MGRSIFPSHSLRVESFFLSCEEKSLRAQKRIGTWRFSSCLSLVAASRRFGEIAGCIESALPFDADASQTSSDPRTVGDRSAADIWSVYFLPSCGIFGLKLDQKRGRPKHDEFLTSSLPTLPSVEVRNPTGISSDGLACTLSLSALCASMTWFLSLRQWVTHRVR